MATDNRKNRVEESRALNDRYAEAARYLAMEHQDDLYVDESKIPPGFKYLWIRVSCLGKPDIHRMSAMSRRGWFPVPAGRHAELLLNDQGQYEANGLILCERPTELSELEWSRHNKNTLQILKSIPGQERFMDDPSMPIHAFNNETMLEQQIDTRSFPE